MFCKSPKKQQSGFVNILTEFKGYEEPETSVILHAVYDLIISLDLQTEKTTFLIRKSSRKKGFDIFPKCCS
jgi:hypothetical protein